MPVSVDRIQKSVRKLRKFVKKAPTQPTPEQVHDLRTNARKLESALYALSLDSNGNEQRLLKSVKRIRKRAGRIRDMDVLTAHVCSVKLNGERDCEVQLLEDLGARRLKYAKKLHSSVLKESAVWMPGSSSAVRCWSQLLHSPQEHRSGLHNEKKPGHDECPGHSACGTSM